MNKELCAVAEYIEKYWAELIKESKPENTLIKMPKQYVVPGGIFEEWYYWDSFFIILGLKVNKKNELIKNIVDNFLFCIEKYGFVPNGNRTYYLSRSQPPYLTSMIKIVWELFQDKGWLAKAYKLVGQEYNDYWLGNNHLTTIGLSRYYDKGNINRHDKEKEIWQDVEIGEEELAEAESGWDFTPRFNSRCSKVLPIDLNCNLYQYEQDLACFSQVLDKGEEKKWKEKSKKREKIINKYIWNEKDGLFYDYDFEKGEQVKIKTLATFYPLWVKLANKQQAERVKNNLIIFEKDGGLVTCDQDYGQNKKQWNYPNGWAPLQWIAIEGLMNYGYQEDAKRLAQKWLNLIVNIYKKTGKLWEKYNVVNCSEECPGRYRNQAGFGWTNGIFLELISKNNYAGRSLNELD
ncbi:MAG: alpha,alpha-trehalase [Candidatus Margulisbacteria bacterium]|nr:alpha,alpha-trehalase [Candidatus Margulisiibacteriota bacterium]